MRTIDGTLHLHSYGPILTYIAEIKKLKMVQYFCKALLFFLLCAAFFMSQATQPKMDSLLNVLRSMKEDTTKVNVLNALRLELCSHNPDTSIILASQALSLSEKVKSKKHIADSYYAIGCTYYEIGNYPTSLENYFKALSLRQELADKAEIAKSLGRIGMVYFDQSDFPKSLNYYFKALKLQEELADKSAIAKLLREIGLVYKYESNYPKTLNYYFRALQLEVELADKSRIANTLGNIGMVYSVQGDYSKGLDFFFKSLKIEEELGNKYGIAWILQMLGGIYERLNDTANVLKNLKAALKIQEEIRDKVGAAQTHNSIGNHYSIQRKYPEALEHFFAAENIFKELGIQAPRWGIPWCYLQVGEIFEKQGDSASIKGDNATSELKYLEALKKYLDALKIHETTKVATSISQDQLYIGNIYIKLKKFSLARVYLEKGLQSSKAENDKENLKQGYESLSNLNYLQGYFKQAFDCYKLYITFRDTLVNGENVKKSTQLMMNYDFEKTQAAEKAGHEKEMAVAGVEINRQKLMKNSFIWVLAFAIVLFFLVYNNFRTRQKLKLETIRNNIAADLHDDIGSTLNSISLFSEVAKHEAGKPIPALDQIGVSARKIIDAMGDIVWTINPENDTFENVIARMRSLAYLLFKAKGIEFVFKADDGLNKLSLPMLARKNVYMLFKEATNNIVKYSNASRASFHISSDDRNVKLVIRDNGVGFNIESATDGGNGIKNMKRRAAEIGGQLTIESAEGKGTNIELTFKT
jgi:two-component system sensor histidine kinase UhpB